MTRIALPIATVVGVGYAPTAPGTAGSAAGLVVVVLLKLGGPAAEIAGALIVLVVGAWAAGAAERHFGREDPGPVVIDEVLGQVVTLALLPVGWFGLVVGFLLFRILDVIKPYPADRLEELGGGMGIMLDDLVAGLYGQGILRVAVWALPGVL